LETYTYIELLKELESLLEKFGSLMGAHPHSRIQFYKNVLNEMISKVANESLAHDSSKILRQNFIKIISDVFDLKESFGVMTKFPASASKYGDIFTGSNFLADEVAKNSLARNKVFELKVINLLLKCGLRICPGSGLEDGYLLYNDFPIFIESKRITGNQCQIGKRHKEAKKQLDERFKNNGLNIESLGIISIDLTKLVWDTSRFINGTPIQTLGFINEKIFEMCTKNPDIKHQNAHIGTIIFASAVSLYNDRFCYVTSVQLHGNSNSTYLNICESIGEIISRFVYKTYVCDQQKTDNKCITLSGKI